jgi:cell division septation protein DedD
MSVLSRRLERFAVGFTIATFAFFLIGLYAAANNKGQVVFFFAGLVSMCLFASFFLWLAHGFAWAMIPEGPVVAKKPAEALKPAEVLKPAEALKPADAMKPAEAKRPAEAMKAAEEKKPAEEKVIAPEEDPPDAKYTITGRRLY